MNTEVPDRLRFPYGGFLWDGYRSFMAKNGRRVVTIDGPLCKECKVKLSVNTLSEKASCIVCKKSFPYEKKFGGPSIEDEAKAYLEAKHNEQIPVISFDLTPTKVIEEDNKDENYWIQAKIVQKDGKRLAVVYLGEKIHGEQNKNDYVQLFVDIEDEQVRFDKGNKNPMKLLSSIVAEFQNSTTTIKKRSKKI
jgi:hypothetical protein